MSLSVSAAQLVAFGWVTRKAVPAAPAEVFDTSPLGGLTHVSAAFACVNARSCLDLLLFLPRPASGR